MSKKKYYLDIPDIGSTEDIEIVEWRLREGDSFTKGQEICELVTEKTTFPLEAPFSGLLEEILKPAGSQVKSGQTVAKIICDQD